MDLRTVLITDLLAHLVGLLVLLALWRQVRSRFSGLGYWMAGFALQIVAYLLIAARGAIPDLISMVLSNLLVVMGAIAFYEGLGRFVGERTPQRLNLLMLVAFTAVHAWFSLVQPDLDTRNLNISLAILWVAAQSAYLLLWRVKGSMRSLARLAGAVNAAYCVVSIARVVKYFVLPHQDLNYLHSGTFETIVLICFEVLSMIYAFALVMMVTQRLLGEVAFQEQKFSKAFRSSPYAITLTRLSDGLVTDVNDGFEHISGYSRKETLGRTSREMRLWEQDQDRDEVVAELRRSGKVKRKEAHFRKKTGERIIGIFSAEILPIDDQLFILTSIEDATELRRIEEEQRMAEASARQTQKLEAIGTLASGVAHEINSPLNVIMNFGDLILDHPDDPPQVKEFAQNIVKESERVALIVRNLLSFSRPESEPQGPVNIGEIVDRTLSLTLSLFNKDHILIENRVTKDLPQVRCRAQQIQQVLMNLLTNSKDALLDRDPDEEKPRTIRIFASVLEAEGELGQRIRLSVQDNGSGIQHDISGRIFDPFFTTKGRSKGTGLGLSISYGIIKENQGAITFESAPGEGTTFHVDLPAA